MCTHVANVLQAGPILSAVCNDTTALVTWDLTELDAEQKLEHLYVEYSCSANSTELNTTDQAGSELVHQCIQ